MRVSLAANGKAHKGAEGAGPEGSGELVVVSVSHIAYVFFLA